MITARQSIFLRATLRISMAMFIEISWLMRLARISLPKLSSVNEAHTPQIIFHPSRAIPVTTSSKCPFSSPQFLQRYDVDLRLKSQIFSPKGNGKVSPRAHEPILFDDDNHPMFPDNAARRRPNMTLRHKIDRSLPAKSRIKSKRPARGRIEDLPRIHHERQV